jgi:membrane-associated phospholipid phosphatase
MDFLQEDVRRWWGRVTVAAALVASSALALAPAAHADDPVIQWNRTLLGIVRTPGAQPATVHPTRSMALLHVAIYDAVEAIERRSELYGIDAQGPHAASRRAAADVAAHDVLAALYPAQEAQLDQQEARALQAIPDGAHKDQGARVGADVAAKVLALRYGDGSDAKPPPYVTTGLPGDYRPAPPGFAAPVFTHWAQVKPWVLRTADQFEPAPPPALTSAQYTADYNQVKSLGDANSATRTADQTQIARFWPGPIQNYWNEIAQTAALATGATLSEQARVFAQLDLAIADDVIAFYQAKYAYRVWRPITAIREGANDGNPDTAGDPNWTPLLGTPADPAYPGAHSVIGASSAAILAAAFGDRLDYTVTSEVLPGVTRSFDSFSAAVQESGLSRTLAGVHTHSDDVAGQGLGRDIAQHVLTHALAPRHGASERAHVDGQRHR